MIWRFSDGTTVELGGKVEGATVLAQQLRRDLPGARVAIWPEPSDPVDVDVNDAAIVEAWLRAELDLRNRLRGLKLTLQSPSDIPDLPPPEYGDEPAVEGRVY